VITLETIKAEIRANNPTFRFGTDQEGYRDFTPEEYEAHIEMVAQYQYAKHLEQVAEAEKLEQKAILLERLGITDEEAKLLLS